MEKKRFLFRRILRVGRSWSKSAWKMCNETSNGHCQIYVRNACIYKCRTIHALLWDEPQHVLTHLMCFAKHYDKWHSTQVRIFEIRCTLIPIQKSITHYFQRTLWHFQLPFSIAISSAVFPRLDLAVVSAPFAIKYLTTSSFPGCQFN